MLTPSQLETVSLASPTLPRAITAMWDHSVFFLQVEVRSSMEGLMLLNHRLLKPV